MGKSEKIKNSEVGSKIKTKNPAHPITQLTTIFPENVKGDKSFVESFIEMRKNNINHNSSENQKPNSSEF